MKPFPRFRPVPRRLASVSAIALILSVSLIAALSASTDNAAPISAGSLQVISAPRIAQLSSPPEAPEPGDAAIAVRRAWERARAASAYHFGTDLVETAYPALSLSNAGNGPRKSELHLEGAVDLTAERIELRMWQGAGNLLTPDTASEARFEDGRAYTRAPGGAWKETSDSAADLSAGFAPTGDPLAFLAGIKNARAVAPGDDPLADGVTRYVFEFDGPALATYMRDRLEEQLREKGELPLNMSLDISSEFRDATGEGELWVDGRGLPVRLAAHLEFAEKRDGSRVEADVRTDFSGYPEQVAVAPNLLRDPVGALREAVSGLGASPAAAAKQAGPGGALLAGAASIALLVGCRRSRKLYAAVVIAVMVSMVLVPLMQSERAWAFFERNSAGDAQGSEESRQARERLAELTRQWNPHQDPLGDVNAQEGQAGPVVAQPDLAPALEEVPAEVTCDQGDKTDPDADGLNNFDECRFGTDPEDPDSDGDGLSDGMEINRLGTDPHYWDTDSDQITDTLEVQGFLYQGQRWYLDPKNPDTNKDGQLDSLECLALQTTAGPNVETICDTDGDGIPDPFDIDNDNDGVPDRVDLSSETRIDRNGLGVGQPAASAAFDKANPFLITLRDLQAGWPVLVDYQIRPVNPDHLSYALNVLDWPSNDRDGQIQHGKDTTFATSDNPDLANPDDPAGSHGDMRLIPLLELTITGTQAPLKLTDQKVTATARAAFSATVALEADLTRNDSRLAFAFDRTGEFSVAVYKGRCPGVKPATPTFSGVTSGASTAYPMPLIDLANGEHSVIMWQGSDTVCAAIPDMVTGPYTDKMIDQSVLEPFGVTVQDTGTGSLVAYLPVNVVSDDTGGGKTAFQAHMVYWPGVTTGWLEAQQLRLVWLVNMLTDECDDSTFDTWDVWKAVNPDKTEDDYQEARDKHCETHRTMDVAKPVQRYYEDWYLTGLNVREDHGLDVAIVSPHTDGGPTYDDDALWGLSWGLGQQFLTGRACETDATLYDGLDDTGACAADSPHDLPDISIYSTDKSGQRTANSTIRERFGYASSVTGNARWDVPAGSLDVEDHRFDSVDYLAYLSAYVTPKILDRYDKSLTPTLLLAREEHYRAAGLESAVKESAGIRISLDAANHPAKTLRAINWAPYIYQDGAWQGYSKADYYPVLGDRLRLRFWNEFPTATADEIEGRVAVARGYYMGLVGGAVQTLDLTRPHHDGASDTELATARAFAENTLVALRGAEAAGVASAWSWLSEVTSRVLREIVNAMGATAEGSAAFGNSGVILGGGHIYYQPSTVYGIIGKGLNAAKGNSIGPWQGMWNGGGAYRGVGIALVAVAVVTMAVCMVIGLTTDKDTISLLMAAGMLALSIQFVAMAMTELVKAVNAVGGFAALVSGNLLKASLSQLKSTFLANKGGVVGAVISVASAWGSFFYSWFGGGLQAGSMAWDDALATMIAATIVTVILFLVYNLLGPLGMLLKTIIGLIDALIGMICSAFLTAEQQASEAGQWICGGITGAIKKLFKWMIYSGEIMVDMAPDEDKGPPWYPRLTFGGLDIDLERPDDGIVAGNKIGFKIPLTNTLDLAKIPISPWTLLWSGQWNEKNLAKANFKYKWQAEETDFHEELNLGGMSPAWDKSSGRPYTSKTEIGTGVSFPLAAAGINKSFSPLYVSEAWAVPEQECWGWFPYGGCGISTERGTYHYDFGSSLVFDILPADLTGFYRLSAATYPRWRLAWGTDAGGSTSFPMLYDADGDGLPASADANDSLWDTDFDGLSDQFEQTTGSWLSNPDTDGDGLSDAEEVRAGTNPRLKDTDGDGLADGDEVYHQDLLDGDRDGNTAEWLGGWDTVYGYDAGGNRLITRVYSDPTLVDADGDGLTDRQEWTFGFNPNVPSVANVLTLESEVSESAGGKPARTDGFVKPGDTLYYTATVKNELELRQAEGLLSTVAVPLLDATKIPKAKSFVLDALEEVQQTGTLGVRTTAASGAYSLTQVAGARITDWRSGSGGASLWLRFDDAASPYHDTSGSQPLHDGACVGGGCSLVADGLFGSAVHFAGNSHVHSDAPVSPSGFAVAFWFKPDADGPMQGSVLFTDRDPATGRKRVEILYMQNYVRVNMTGCSGTTCFEQSVFTTQDLRPQQWHHVVHTYGSGAGGQKLYLNGQLIDQYSLQQADASAPSSNVNIGGSPMPGALNFVGTMDDVRVYDRGLPAGEVAQLANQPVFRMDFEKGDGWEDVTPFHQPVACASSVSCPAHDASGIQANAARFNGTSYLNVTSNTQLDLSAGKYSISAWIYPEKGCGFDAERSAKQSIVGSDETLLRKYPTLSLTTDPSQNVAAISTGFGSGTAWESGTGPWNVPFGRWTHVVATFNTDESDSSGKKGTWRLYTDGVEAWSDVVSVSGARPYRSIQFQLGAGPAEKARGYHSFCGKIDEFVVYNRVLDVEAVARLTQDGASALHLPFDEAPGATAFRDTSAAARPVSCRTGACPVSGVTGRLNRAVAFDGAAGQMLVLPNSAINRLTSNFSVAAWVKPAATAGNQWVISTGPDKGGQPLNGWGFGLHGNDVQLFLLGNRGYTLAGIDNVGAQLQPNRWYHVAAVMDATNAVSFYVNGVFRGKSAAFATGGIPDPDDDLLIGGAGSSANPLEKFTGLIDDLWVYGSALSADQVAGLYRAAPVLHLPFEEASGSHSFADNATYGRTGTCSGDGCPLTGEGIRGQVGLAAQFDGVNDAVTVAITPPADAPQKLTISAWIRPSSFPTTTTTSEHRVLEKVGPGWGEWLRLNVNQNMNAVLSGSCGSYSFNRASTTPLIAEHWNHVAITYDRGVARLYANGYERVEGNVSGSTSCSYGGDLRLGGAAASSFAGRVDEVTVYDYPLWPSEILDLYNYQSGWVEDRQSLTLVVDNEPPTASVVITSGLRLADWPIVVPLDARDASSGIQSVDLGYNKAGAATAWTAAVPCADPTEGPAWCARFTPAGEGVYYLKARATDRVGRSAESAAKTVVIDSTAPQMGINLFEGTVVAATRSPSEANTWLVRLTGLVGDKPLYVSGTESGVPGNGVRVTIRDAEGEALGEVGQFASIEGGYAGAGSKTWSIDYRVRDARPDGCYTVEVEAIDNILAGTPNLPEALRAAHRSSYRTGLTIDSGSPGVVLDQATVAGGILPASATTLRGESSARPVPVQVNLATASGADLTSVKLTCQHGNEGSWYTVFDIPAGQLRPGAGSAWAGELHKGASCKVEMTGPAAPTTAGVAGTITVCGEALILTPAWTGNFSGALTIPFVVDSGKCLARGCAADQQVAGSQKVEVAFTSMLEGPVWLNEAPLIGEVARLPFDDTPGSDGAVVARDVSGLGNHSSACSGETCPTPGQAGLVGSAYAFDGKDDGLSIPDSDLLDFGAGQDFAVMAWIKPAATQGWTLTADNDVIEKWSGSGGYPYVIRFLNEKAGANAGKIQGARWDGAKNPSVTSTRRIDDGRFHHVAFVRYGGVLKLYVDGVESGASIEDSTTGATANASPLYIGRRGGSANPNYFAGQVDDLRIFNRAVSSQEIMNLYRGTGPLVTLSFEAPFTAGGNSVADSSSWGRNGLLETGSGDRQNKAAPGQVGNTALWLDGADDFVSLGDVDTLDSLGDFTISQWFSVDELAAPATGRDWAAPVGKGKWTGATDGWAVLVNRSATVADHTIQLYFNGAPVAAIPGPADGNGWQVGQWRHYAFTRRGSTLRGYLDGAERMAPVSTTVVPAANSEPVLLGKNAAGPYPWDGGLDELRIYARGLGANEIADLYNAGWRTATAAASGESVERTSWTIPVPAAGLGLEGTYRVDLRGTDTKGHKEAVSGRSLWQGEIDNTAPRVTLCKQLNANKYVRYVAVAQDYNLVEEGFKSPCAITSRANYQSPWLLRALPAGQAKLYEVRADCPWFTTPPPEQATACDRAGNCATVGLSTGDVCAAILAGSAVVSTAEASDPAAVAQAPLPPAPRPVLAITPTVLTATHYSALGHVAITGYITGTNKVTGVTVRVDGETGSAQLAGPAPEWPHTTTWTYAWQPPGGAPDGIRVMAMASATVSEGTKVPVTTAQLTVDVLPPAEVVMTLTADGAQTQPGAILRAGSPQLQLAWEASRDGSGVADYTVRWATTTAVTQTLDSRVLGPDGPFEDQFRAGEAQQVAVELVMRDPYGNERSQPFGALLVDGPLTPDWVRLPAGQEAPADRAWMESDCAAAGSDDRAARVSGGQHWPEQRGYATWDQRGLRIAWTGANWNTDGDLFIYLDTGDGGGGDTFTPHPLPEKSSKILLPPGMAADRLIWVEDGQKASLLKWEGAGWTVAGVLTSDQYRFNPAGRGQTDLYMPFEMLGMAGGGGLAVVAFATEEPNPAEGLQLWATLPKANPVNSARANERAPIGKLLAARGFNIPLLHFGRWPSTGDGVCPNARVEGQKTDIRLEVSMAADPSGAVALGLESPMFWSETPSEVVAAAVAGDASVASAASPAGGTPGTLLFELMSADNPPLRDGQEIVYTARVVNKGSQTLTGAWLALGGYGALRLLEERVELGDIPAGEAREAVFHGVADLSRSPSGLAAALAEVYAAGFGPESSGLEYLLAAHRVDRGAPAMPGIDLGGLWVGPNGGHLSGYASDESGIAQITLELTGPQGGVLLVTCPVIGQETGRWTCQWDAAAANGGSLPPDGAEITLRVQATDRRGNVSEWSRPHTVRFDGQPPALTLAGGLNTVQRGALRLGGKIADLAGLGALTVCVDGTCARQSLMSGDGARSRWNLAAAVGASDFQTHTVTVQAADALGNRMREPRAFEIIVDNVAPRVAANQLAGQLVLGSRATVLSGTATDGGPSVRTWVRVEEPGGDLVRRAVARAGGEWTFDLTGERPGRYLLTVEARDEVGNMSEAGPFAVDVTCANAALAVTSVRVEPADGVTLTLTVQATLANAGPDELPAGIPVGFYDANGRLAALTTTAPLPSGGEETLAVAPWAVPEPGSYDLYVVPDDRDLGLPSPVTFCTTPPATRAVIRAGLKLNQRLYMPVILQGAPAG